MRLHGKARALMRRVETVRCERTCWPYCGIVPASRDELERIRTFCEANGLPFIDLRAVRHERDAKIAAALRANDAAAIMVRGVGLCPYLTDDFACSIYPARPVICRLWGAVEELPCAHGCAPEGGRLDVDDTNLLVAALKATGWWELRKVTPI